MIGHFFDNLYIYIGNFPTNQYVQNSSSENYLNSIVNLMLQNFGWDPIFQVKGLDKTYAELGSEKNKVSHRFKAFDEMVKFLRETPDFI